jgi:hypothetical protein
MNHTIRKTNQHTNRNVYLVSIRPRQGKNSLDYTLPFFWVLDLDIFLFLSFVCFECFVVGVSIPMIFKNRLFWSSAVEVSKRMGIFLGDVKV